MKLGLKIEITSQGAGTQILSATSALEKYASASRSYIQDVFPARQELKQKGVDPMTSLDESSRTVTFLRFLGPQGYLICIFQARPENSGRPYDGAAAWIHIPASVVLSGNDTVKLIDEVESALSNEKGIQYPLLDQIFAKDYPERKCMPAIAYIGSNGESSAVRYYGNGTDYQLNELLGNGVAQPEYGQYKAVFLLRKNDGFAFTGAEITSPLIPTCTMEPPAAISGFTAHFENGTPFSLPIEIAQGTPITLVWKKKGYADIKKTNRAISANANEVAQLFRFTTNEVLKAVPRHWFNVHCEGQQISKCQISIENQPLEDIIYVPETKFATGVKVCVNASGFLSFCKEVMLSDRMDISLKRKVYHYEFSIPLRRVGKHIEEDGLFVLETQHKLYGCPIEGYSLMDEFEGIQEGDGNVNRLERGGLMASLRPFVYGFLTCVGLILAILLWNFIDNIDDVKLKFGWPPIEFVMRSSKTQQWNDDISEEQISPDETSTPARLYTNEMAIAYLNSKETWCKDSIANYQLLDGLFEALNEYKFDELTNIWAEPLKEVSKFDAVVKAAQTAKTGGWNPRQGEHTPNYNKDDDNLIKIENYINWISKDQSTQSSNGQSTQTGNTGGSVQGGVKATPVQVPKKENRGGKI